MSSRSYGNGEKAALIALSKNHCYAPGCTEPVILTRGGAHILNLEIAHIRALEKAGPRHDPNFPNPNAFSNLLLLCKPDHKLIDQIRPNEYSVETLLGWKSACESSGVEDLAGLRNLTEDRLQELITESYESFKEQMDGALARFAEFDSEAAAVLIALRDELVDGLRSTSVVDPEVAYMLNNAAHHLRGLDESALALSHAADSLNGVSDVAELLASTASSLDGLADVADSLASATNDAKVLFDVADALRASVDDLRRYSPDY